MLCKQDELQWPGLAKEVKDMCVELDLPNIMKENINKSSKDWYDGIILRKKVELIHSTSYSMFVG